MVELVILRHGNTFDKGDTILRVGARTDLPLSNSGRAQADTIGSLLAGRFGRFQRIFAAPLKRTMETATAVHAATGSAAEIERAAGLTEIDYGPDEGQPETTVLGRIGAVALAAWEARAEPPEGWLVDPPKLTENWRAFFKSLANEPGPVLAVTSNGVARFALAAATAHGDAFPQKLKTAAYGIVQISPAGEAQITAWNLRD